MKQFYFIDGKELFPARPLASQTFRVCSRDRYALLGLLRGESALFQKKDCFECPPANAEKRVCWPGGKAYLTPTENAA